MGMWVAFGPMFLYDISSKVDDASGKELLSLVFPLTPAKQYTHSIKDNSTASKGGASSTLSIKWFFYLGYSRT